MHVYACDYVLKGFVHGMPTQKDRLARNVFYPLQTLISKGSMERVYIIESPAGGQTLGPLSGCQQIAWHSSRAHLFLSLDLNDEREVSRSGLSLPCLGVS